MTKHRLDEILDRMETLIAMAREHTAGHDDLQKWKDFEFFDMANGVLFDAANKTGCLKEGWKERLHPPEKGDALAADVVAGVTEPNKTQIAMVEEAGPGVQPLPRERREFRMTDAQLATLLEACRSVPYLVIGGVEPRSPQANANAAWKALASEMGFEWETVGPIPGKGHEWFTAIPSTPILKAMDL